MNVYGGIMQIEQLKNAKVKMSIVVPAYNAEKFLPECIKNLVDQTFFDIYGEDSMELIFVDDKSTDDTLEILRKYENQYSPKIKVYENPVNGGPGGARNLGISKASGVYIGCVDADDIADKTMFEKLYKAAVRDDLYADMVDSGADLEELGVKAILTRESDCGEVTDDTRSYLIANLGFPWTRIYRRDFLDENNIKYRENVILEDNDFLIEVIAKIKTLALVPEILYFYRNDPESICKRDAEVSFFEMNVKCIRAIYEKTHLLENYSSIRDAVEMQIWDTAYRTVYNIDELYRLGGIDEAFMDKMLGILRNEVVRCVTSRPEDNCYVAANGSKEVIDRLGTFIQGRI